MNFLCARPVRRLDHVETALVRGHPHPVLFGLIQPD
jgi:hypothetical protein